MPPSRSNRIKAERRGRWGEYLAIIYLTLCLYRLRAMRVRTPVGEVDLVVSRGKTTVFVEVKVRARAADEGMALEAVNKRRISRAANYYLSKNPHLARQTIRFDVIFLAPFARPRHVKGAFELSE